ncbi:MAG TPA: hypothetical protein VFW00_00965, partial [Rhodocyclaceae bacterium]|nr:hypothetical protein [Rhodocyclaceae bacterium]
MKLASAVVIAVAVSGLSYAQSTAVSQAGAKTEAATGASAKARVEAFSPQGEVKGVRQVVARFSEPMVAFGDPRLPSPFDATCASKGSGHWVDVRNWVYDFESDLPGGLKCSFTTRAKLVAQSGVVVSAATFNFTTGGPAIRESWPSEGDESIDENQTFLLGLDADADLATVRQLASCNVNGIGERIPLQIVEGDERAKILTEQQGHARNFFAVITKHGRLGFLAVKDKRLDVAPIVVARCARRLPAGAEVHLVWGAGIRTASGVATSKEQTLTFKVREEFSAKQSCERANAKSGCVPVLPITLNFTAPIDAALAAKIELRTADGRSFYPKLDDRAKAVEGVSFNGPFDAQTEVTISLPSKFRDDAGRELSNAASFPLRVRIDEDPPLVKFSSHFGILESKAQPVLPVSVRNVEATVKGLQSKPFSGALTNGSANSVGSGNLARIDTDSDERIATWLTRVLTPPNETRETQEAFEKKFDRYPREGELPLLFNNTHEFKATPLKLPRLEGEKTLELVGIPLPKPGFYVVEFASNRLGAALHNEKKPYYTYSSALVTNMAVHFKLGRESS